MRVMLPLMPAIVAFGASFGVLATAAGVDSLAALVMSATTFAGSAQMAVVLVLGPAAPPSAAIGAAVLLNARYGPMALAAPGRSPAVPLRRLLEVAVARRRELGALDRDGRFDRQDPAWRRRACSTSAGTPARRSAWWRGEPRRSRRRSASTPPSRRSSSPCSPRSCGTGASPSPPPCSAAASRSCSPRPHRLASQ